MKFCVRRLSRRMKSGQEACGTFQEGATSLWLEAWQEVGDKVVDSGKQT